MSRYPHFTGCQKRALGRSVTCRGHTAGQTGLGQTGPRVLGPARRSVYGSCRPADCTPTAGTWLLLGSRASQFSAVNDLGWSRLCCRGRGSLYIVVCWAASLIKLDARGSLRPPGVTKILQTLSSVSWGQKCPCGGPPVGEGGAQNLRLTWEASFLPSWTDFLISGWVWVKCIPTGFFHWDQIVH